MGATKLFDGMVADVQGVLKPAMQRADAADFAVTFPTLARFADEWQRSTSAKSHALSDSQVALSTTFTNADQIPWMFILPGIALVLLAGIALGASPRSVTASVPRAAPAAATAGS